MNDLLFTFFPLRYRTRVRRKHCLSQGWQWIFMYTCLKLYTCIHAKCLCCSPEFALDNSRIFRISAQMVDTGEKMTPKNRFLKKTNKPVLQDIACVQIHIFWQTNFNSNIVIVAKAKGATSVRRLGRGRIIRSTSK